MIKVMNVRHTKPSKPYDIYIDRRSVLGNKFYMHYEVDRIKVCEQYKEWFKKRLKEPPTTDFHWELSRLLSLYNQYKKLHLFCWCAPKQCHGDTIKKWLEDAL